MSLDLSDDDIFFGKLTLKEVKKRIFFDKPYAVSAVNSPREDEDQNTSVKILQTHSEPNLLTNKSCNQNSSDNTTFGWDMREDDSFIKLENMVEKLCVSSVPTSNKNNQELNNTLEVIEYILNNPPNSENNQPNGVNNSEDVPINKSPESVQIEKDLNELCLKKLNEISPQKTKIVNRNVAKHTNTPQNTPVKSMTQFSRQAGYMTPLDNKQKPVFKTPGQPLSLKKPTSTSSLKKTPSKSKAYQHISSPVASYIKNCPIVPLVKDVHPKKPLPGLSSIPKLKNTIPVKQSNKENVNLPSIAYKSAKKTQLIDLPEEQKLPQSQWAKKLITSLPRPMVIKHNHRELNFAKKKLLPQQEDSFADLSCNQAEVSVCTQKPAFKLNRNF